MRHGRVHACMAGLLGCIVARLPLYTLLSEYLHSAVALHAHARTMPQNLSLVCAPLSMSLPPYVAVAVAVMHPSMITYSCPGAVRMYLGM